MRRIAVGVAGVLLVLGALLGSAPQASSEPPPCQRTPLRVILYPFVPAKDAYFLQVKTAFEEKNPGIDLQIVDLSENYYDEDSPKAVTNTPADVIELDAVFLDDFVAAGKVAELPPQLVRPPGTFLKPAEQAVMVGEKVYGAPHWVCSNFLFTRADDSLSAATLADLATQIGAGHGANAGLLIDMKGRSTLGEWYVDSLLDRYKTLSAAAPYLNAANTDQATLADLKTVRGLCDSDLCRDKQYHGMTGFYAGQFARQRGRALAGYSERLYYIGTEGLADCRKGECVGLDQVKVSALPLANAGSQPFAWVDAFVISNTCTGPCRDAAEKFLGFMTDVDQVRATLTPGYGEAPRYLLPALAALYGDADLLAKAPLYAKLQPLVADAVPIRGPHLNHDLREIGSKVDGAVPQ